MADRYGYPAGDALGQPAHRLLRTSFPRALADIEAMLLSRNSWTGGAIHRHADGGPVPAVNRWTLCRDAAGDAWRVTEVHSDIGRPVAAPDADLAASNEALADIVVSHEALADIIALLAHELSEPLTAIGNYVAGARRILQAGWPDLGQARMAMGEAVRQIGRGGDGVSLLRAVAAAIRER
jgi:signal transduction histidine kinase